MAAQVGLSYDTIFFSPSKSTGRARPATPPPGGVRRCWYRTIGRSAIQGVLCRCPVCPHRVCHHRWGPSENYAAWQRWTAVGVNCIHRYRYQNVQTHLCPPYSTWSAVWYFYLPCEKTEIPWTFVISTVAHCWVKTRICNPTIQNQSDRKVFPLNMMYHASTLL